MWHCQLACYQQVPDPSAAKDEGLTALHNAICAGHFPIVRFLVEFGCDVNAQDSDGWYVFILSFVDEKPFLLSSVSLCTYTVFFSLPISTISTAYCGKNNTPTMTATRKTGLHFTGEFLVVLVHSLPETSLRVHVF